MKEMATVSSATRRRRGRARVPSTVGWRRRRGAGRPAASAVATVTGVVEWAGAAATASDVVVLAATATGGRQARRGHGARGLAFEATGTGAPPVFVETASGAVRRDAVAAETASAGRRHAGATASAGRPGRRAAATAIGGRLGRRAGVMASADRRVRRAFAATATGARPAAAAETYHAPRESRGRARAAAAAAAAGAAGTSPYKNRPRDASTASRPCLH